MRSRFLITCVFGGIAYTFGSVITPQEDSLGVMFAPIIGAIFTAIVCCVFLWPLRAGVRSLFPRLTGRAQGFVAFAVVAAVIAALALFTSESSLLVSRLGVFAFWSFYALVIIACWFWPEKSTSQIPVSKFDHTA